MLTENIRWGSYGSWEGPYTLGKIKFSVPQNSSDEDKFLSVITATEGGCYDAVNMYDSCMLSAGIIQWCETFWNVSNMFGSVAEVDPSLLAPLKPALDLSNASFKKRPDGRWRFFFNDSRGEVKSAKMQRALFFKNSTGEKGSWDDESKEHARTWAACVASVWGTEASRTCQTKFTSKRLGMFLTKESREIMFGPAAPTGNDGMVGAMRAAFYSFAANLPAVAAKHLQIASQSSSSLPWTDDWIIGAIKQLTFGPKISIYPGRYNKIRPVIESIYGVDLPDFSSDLEKWHADMGKSNDAPDFLETKEIQEELILEGYDLGPRGADGVFGAKTSQAVRDFQTRHNLVSDGIVGPKTRRALAQTFLKRASNA